MNREGIPKMLTKVFCTCIIMFVFLAKGYPQQGLDKKTFKEKFQEAEYFFLRGDFQEAAFLYHELLKADPTNANLQFLTGASYLSVDGLKERAIPFLEQAVASVSPGYREGSYRERNAPREAFFALARAYHIENRFEEAITYYEKYKNVMPLYDAAEIDYVAEQIASVSLAKQMIRDTIRIGLKDAGNMVNGASSAFHAVMAEKDSVLIFMSEKPFYSAIMMTRKRNGNWEKPVNINDQIRGGEDCQITDISTDGSELFLVKQDGLDKNLYVSHFKKGGWSEMEKLPEPVNSQWDETHASISADMKTLCFTSNRPGGCGAMDIYFSHPGKDGSWSNPVNAGKPVNSIYSEETPFLTEDGKTLYFSSMGHATMGGFDIFYSTRLPDDTWSVPANLGFPLSTSDDDLFFFPLADGKAALYSSFHQPMPEGRIEWISFITGSADHSYIIDGNLTAEDNVDISASAEVKIIDTGSGDTVASVAPDPETGNYTAEVPSGNYNIVINSDQYSEQKLALDIKPGITREQIHVETSLQPEKVTNGTYLLVKNILFGFDSIMLDKQARFELEKLCQVMTTYPDLFVQVRGHSDSRGASDYNLALSRQRARSVVDYLVARGISRERFISSGVGERGNVARNINPDGTDNPEGRKLNRQVEIMLINNHYENIRMDELKVPESLKPMRDKRYYVILEQPKKKLNSFPANVEGHDTRLFETEKGCLYAAGPFSIRTEATKFLNTVIDGDFSDAFMLGENDFTRLLSTSDLSPEEVQGPFTIQLMALKNETDFDVFSHPENIQLYEGKDGYHRYVTGIFETHGQAMARLSHYLEEGYTDAFVMPLSNYITISPAEPDRNTSNFYFTIQITATKNRPDPSGFTQLRDLRITKGNDGFFRISEGIYMDMSDAEKALQRVRGEGYTDAFIRKVRKGEEN